MNKRMISFTAALLLVCTGAGAGVLDRFSLRVGPGAILPLGGSYTDTQKLNKIVQLGAVMNGGLRCQLSEYFYVDAGYAFNWMPVKKEARPFDYKELRPALNIQMWNLNATLFLSKGFVIQPYLTAGAGICPWRFSETSIWGAPWPASSKPAESFDDTSLGLNAGIGAETHLFSRFSVFLEFKYNYVFTRNPEKFGTDDFNEHDFLGLNVGLVFNLGKK